MPRIHVTAEHDDFIFQLRIGAGNLGDRVVTVEVRVLVCDRDVGFHLHFFAGLDHANNAIVVLNRHTDLRQHLRIFVIRVDATRRVGSERVG